MAVKTAAIKQRSATATAPAKTGNAKAIQRKASTASKEIAPSIQRKEQNGSWLFQQPQTAINSRPVIQPKIKIHPANDRFEKEADHVADKVVSGEKISSSVTISSVGAATQRKHNSREPKVFQLKQHNSTASDYHSGDSSPPSSTTNNASHSLTSVLSSQTTRGSPLPRPTRGHMESRMGADFTNVRIHTGQESHEANTSIGARAFTHGSHIHFANGQYNPNTTTGQHLLAHELTHTIQQGASPSSASSQNIQRSAANISLATTTTDTGSGRGPPIQTQPGETTIQCSLIDTAISRIGELLNDLPSITEGLEGAKRWLMAKVRRFASFIPGYTALGVVLGQDPISGERIERNGRNFLNAALDIIPFGNLLKQKLEELGVIDRAATWIDQQLEMLSGIVSNIGDEFRRAWNDLGLTSILDGPLNILRNFGEIFERAINRLVSFAERAAAELLSIVKQFLLTQLVNFIKNHTNAYELLKVIIGKDPITDEPVARNGTNILNALLELGGELGREQRRQMQDTGTFQKAADWIDRGIAVFGNLYQTIRNNFGLIWDAISIQSLMDPVGTFNRIYETFAAPVRQVLDFVRDALIAILGLIKEVLLRRLSAWARTVRGYALVTVLIGKDPFTNEIVPRSIPNIIRGFMSLMEGGEEQYRQMEESGAIARTTQRINAAVARLNMTPAAILQLFVDLWNSFSFNDLIHPIEAFQRIINRFGEPIARLVAFVIEIVKIVIHVILEIMNFPFDLINNIITRAMAAFERIKRDPIGFLKNLLRAIKQGFIQFFNNIVTHLINGVVGWLTSELRDANVPQPQDLSLRGIISWVLQVLGISMEAIWQKLAAHPRIGPERVARIRSMIDRLEGIWTFIRDVQQRGMAAIWDKIQEQLSNLWNTVLDAVKNWIMERIVSAVTAKLLSMLDPTGIMAVINSAIAIYRAVQSFIRYLRQMLEVVNSFVNGVADIAEGNIATAANYLERTMGRAMPIVIGFLANQVGLSGIGRRIAEMIGAARQMVDRALTWLVNRAVDTGFAIFDRLMSMGRSAVGAVMGFLGIRREFRLANGESHEIYFQGTGQSAALMVASAAPKSVENLVRDRRALTPAPTSAQNGFLTSALTKKQSLDTFIRQSANPSGGSPTPTATLEAQIATRVDAIKQDLVNGDAIPSATSLSAQQQILEALIPNKANPVYSYDWRANRSSGHVQGVKAQERRENLPAVSPMGYLPGDHRGHLIGDRFYGSGIPANLTPMHEQLNLSTFKTYENSLADAYNNLKNQNKPAVLYMDIGAVYPGSDQSVPANHRPTQITVDCKIIKLKDNVPTPQIEEVPKPHAPFPNPQPVLSPLNVNTATEMQLKALFGTELGRLVFSVRRTGFISFDNIGKRLGGSPELERMSHSDFLKYLEALESKRNLIQTKLKVHSSTDHYEREADHVADKVTSSEKISSPVSITKINDGIQRKAGSSDNGYHPGSKVASLLSDQSTRGSPLPVQTKTHMENRMGADFSNVRIHTGQESNEANSSIGARAFTHGSNIYFASGQFNPHTKDGQHLLAHELTHTVQQGAASSTIQRSENTTSSKTPTANKSGGSGLSQGAREYFEDYFKTSLSHVKIHMDSESAILCRTLHVKSFTEDNHIFIDRNQYNPETEEGALLLAGEVSKVLKISKPSAEPASLGILNQMRAALKQIAIQQPAKKKAEAIAQLPAKQKDKKGKGSGKKHGGKSPASHKGDSKKSLADEMDGAALEKGKKKSPSKPEEDPAFQRTIKKAKTRAKQQQTHDKPETKADDAQRAAVAVPNEAQGKAQNRKTDEMGEAGSKDIPFDAASFKADLMKKIEEITPKNLEEANEFKENNKVGEVKNVMGGKVASEKQKTTGPVDQATAEPLHVNDSDNKQPVTLPPTSKGDKPSSIGAKDAAPKKKTDDEISMQEQSASLDDEMKANNITEAQLQGSNEPSFQSALKEKKGAQKDAADKPQLFRKEETTSLKAAETEATGKAASSLMGMYAARGKSFDGVVKQQSDSKTKDEQRRAEVVQNINDKYTAAEKKVNELLAEAEKSSNELFDKGAENARQLFENYVDEKMRAYKRDRYSGFFGGLRWAKDKLFGMPDAVNVFYTKGRDLYMSKMDEVITQVAKTVTEKLNGAKKAIEEGKKAVDDYVSQLPKDLKDVGKEAAESIHDKFDSLEQSVNDKRNQLIEGLSRKYVDNVKKLDERIHELKEANKGLIAKAIGFLKEVWKAIKNIVDLFRTILSKLVSIVGIIIGAPGKFFDNLGAAFSKGFDMFKSRIGEHLENGLMAWLSSQLGVPDLKLPEKFDIASIFGMVLQVMGISYAHIRERAVLKIGEERVALLETTAGIFQRIYKEGFGAIWEIIKEKFTDFKDMIWEAIKSFIRDAVIKAAITFLLSLLNPIAAFIKACMAIYNFLMMLVRMKDRIIDLINSILDAVMLIATGTVDAAAAAIEKAFAKSIPIIIGFLAALLGLNNIGSRVKEIILRIRAKVDKLIDFLIDKAYSVVGPAVEAAMRLKSKGQQLIEKGKEKVIGLGKAAVGKVAGWLGLKKTFTDKNRETHSIFFAKNGSLMVASNEIPFATLLTHKQTEISSMNAGTEKTAKEKALNNANTIFGLIEVTKSRMNDTDDTELRSSLERELNTHFNNIVPHLIILGIGAESDAKLPHTVIATQPGTGGRAGKVIADPLTKNPDPRYTPGRPTVDAPGWQTHIVTIPNYSTIYVELHILSEKLGGPGNQIWNLTPGRKSENRKMEDQAETPAHGIIQQNRVLWYESEITNYRSNAPFTDFAEGIRIKYGFKEKEGSGQWQRVGDVQYNNVFPVTQPDLPGTRDPIPSINTMTRDYWNDVLSDIPGRPTKRDYEDFIRDRNNRGGYGKWDVFINSPEFLRLKAKYPDIENWFKAVITSGKLRGI